MIHTVKGFGIVSKAEVDVFLELSCFFDDPVDVGNLISASSALSKSSLNTWKFTVHVLLNPGLENFEHYFPNLWDKCKCAVFELSLALSFLGMRMKVDLFPALWPLLCFPNLLVYWVQHFFFLSWRLITLQYCSGFCHTLARIRHGFTCIPHPNPPSHLPLHPIPLGLPSAPGPSTCLMHPTWAGDLFHSW